MNFLKVLLEGETLGKPESGRPAKKINFTAFLISPEELGQSTTVVEKKRKHGFISWLLEKEELPFIQPAVKSEKKKNTLMFLFEKEELPGPDSDFLVKKQSFLTWLFENEDIDKKK